MRVIRWLVAVGIFLHVMLFRNVMPRVRRLRVRERLPMLLLPSGRRIRVTRLLTVDGHGILVPPRLLLVLQGRLLVLVLLMLLLLLLEVLFRIQMLGLIRRRRYLLLLYMIERVRMANLRLELALERPQLRDQARVHRRAIRRVQPRERLPRRRLRAPRIRIRILPRRRRRGARLVGRAHRGPRGRRRRRGRRRGHARGDARGAVRLGRDGARGAPAEDRELVLLGLRRARREDVAPQRLQALEVRRLRLLVQLPELRLHARHVAAITKRTE